MKALFNTLILLLMASFANAQLVQAKVDDSKAEKILEQLSEKFKSYASMKIDFTYTMVNKQENINESKKGSIWLKGDKFKLEITGQTIINNTKTVWTYIQEANEVQIADYVPDENGESLTPYQMLTTFKSKYKYRFIKEEVQNGKTVQILDLYPLKGGTTFHRTRLIVDKNAESIISSTLYDRNGGEYTYKLDNMQTNQTLNDAFFIFDQTKYPNVEVIDLR